MLLCLKGLIPQKYIDHLAMLVKAMYSLMEDSISEESLNEAENLLLNFVVLFQEYFGEESMNFNIHLLLHQIFLEYRFITRRESSLWVTKWPKNLVNSWDG